LEWYRTLVRIPKRVKKHWVDKHEKDGLSEWKLSAFIKTQYLLGFYEQEEDQLIFRMRFQKRGGQPMRAILWVRKKELNGIVELILFKGHVESLG
jgi:hypothetical protein